MSRSDLALVAALVLACGSGDEVPSRERAAPPARDASPALESGSSGAGESVPAGSAPVRANAANGARLYAQYCVTCHGARGKGDGPVGVTLVPRPADHSDPVYIGSLSDEHIYQVIAKGGAAVGKSALMAGWGAILKEGDIRDLVAHIRELSGT